MKNPSTSQTKACTFCQIARLCAIVCPCVCFGALAALCVFNDIAVPSWVIAGILVSAGVAFWALGAYLPSRSAAALVDVAKHGAIG